MRTETLGKPIWSAGALLFAAAASLGFLFFGTDWRRIDDSSWPTDDQSRLTQSEAASAPKAFDYSVIWKVMESAVTKPVRKPPPVAVPAAVPYEIVATFSEAEERHSFAILRDRGHKQHLVCVGDQWGGLTILKVVPAGVLVEQGGRRVFLEVVSTDEKSVGVSARSRTTAGSVRPGSVFTPAPEPAPRAQTPLEDYDPYLLTRQEVQAYVKNLPTLLKHVGLKQHYDGEGNVDGLEVVEIAPESVAARRGFRQGDIIREVYGSPLTSAGLIPRIAYKILGDDPPHVETTVTRDGEEEEWTYEIQ